MVKHYSAVVNSRLKSTGGPAWWCLEEVDDVTRTWPRWSSSTVRLGSGWACRRSTGAGGATWWRSPRGSCWWRAGRGWAGLARSSWTTWRSSTGGGGSPAGRDWTDPGQTSPSSKYLRGKPGVWSKQRKCRKEKLRETEVLVVPRQIGQLLKR